jgi:RNA polymerase sigma-70 factor (ECF subfamily)
MILADEDCRRLMHSAQGGDKAAYRALLSSSRDWLLRFYARKVARGLADDLVQDTLMSIHAKRATYDPARPYYPWLAAIARYRWIDALRRIRPEDELGDFDAPVASEEEAVLSRLSLDNLLGHLPDAQAHAIVLVKIEGRSTEEVARITGQSPSLVKVNVHRGLRKLAALVESE